MADKYTDGPWWHEYDNEGNGAFSEWYAIVSDTGEEIGKMELLGDARLVSHAPDLLEACEAAVAGFDKFEITHSITFEGAAEVYVDLTRAIAKARGANVDTDTAIV